MRKIQRIGNLGTINLIGAGLGLHPNLDFNEGRIFDLSGNWATEVVRIRAAKVEELLTPETREIFQSYLLAAKEILESPEIKEKLRQRKELFNGWKEMNPESKRDARNKVNGLSRDITQAIKTGLYMKADELDSKYAQQIAINLAFEFDQMLPRI